MVNGDRVRNGGRGEMTSWCAQAEYFLKYYQLHKVKVKVSPIYDPYVGE